MVKGLVLANITIFQLKKKKSRQRKINYSPFHRVSLQLNQRKGGGLREEEENYLKMRKRKLHANPYCLIRVGWEPDQLWESPTEEGSQWHRLSSGPCVSDLPQASTRPLRLATSTEEGKVGRQGPWP